MSLLLLVLLQWLVLYYQLRLESMLIGKSLGHPPWLRLFPHIGNFRLLLYTLCSTSHCLQSIGQCRHLGTFGSEFLGVIYLTAIILAPLLGACDNGWANCCRSDVGINHFRSFGLVGFQ